MPAAVDRFKHYSAGPSTSAAGIRPVTPDDDNDLEFVSTSVIVGTAGDIKITTHNPAEDVILPNVPVGTYAWRVSRIWENGTTADDLSYTF